MPADALIIVLSDHETGGLIVTETSPEVGVVPEHVFTNTYHTGVSVPIYAWGADSAYVQGVLDNTEVFPLLAGEADLPRTVAVFQNGTAS